MVVQPRRLLIGFPAAWGIVILLLVGGAERATALQVTESGTDTIRFSGNRCGQRVTDRVAMPARAHDVRLRAPRIGQFIRDVRTSRIVARVSGYRREEPKYLTIAALGSRHACVDPAAYVGGWTTRSVRTLIRYRVKRRVQFASYNLRRSIRPQVRPRTILFGSRSSILRMRWRSWGGRRARGRGTLEYNPCVPDCASAKPQYYRVKVKLSRTSECSGGWRYKRLSFRYTASRPAGLPPTHSQGFRC